MNDPTEFLERTAAQERQEQEAMDRCRFGEVLAPLVSEPTVLPDDGQAEFDADVEKQFELMRDGRDLDDHDRWRLYHAAQRIIREMEHDFRVRAAREAEKAVSVSEADIDAHARATVAEHLEDMPF